ncbi:MAG: hypothetical protein JNK10_13335, partial [Cyclobacteriaceae bacterium]|nr:hypothetical protein [Cyclobacteriaceae bacterium]
MIAAARKNYNQHFSEAKYQAFLKDLNGLYHREITFRVAETPVFIPRQFEAMLRQASDEIVDFLVRPDFLRLTEPAIPANLRVPNETRHTLFLALDFGVVDVDGKAEPRLIEMQGFPSLYGWMDVLTNKYREHFSVPADMQSHFGLSSEAYRDMLKRVLLNGHPPESVVLLEIDPLKQNTVVDFLATEAFTGIAPVHIGDVERKGRRLFYRKNGNEIEIRRIYNRVIFDELVKRTDLKLSFNLTEEVDVEWAGHPNWFFRI